jgi:hypothetical protein
VQTKKREYNDGGGVILDAGILNTFRKKSGATLGAHLDETVVHATCFIPVSRLHVSAAVMGLRISDS